MGKKKQVRKYIEDDGIDIEDIEEMREEDIPKFKLQSRKRVREQEPEDDHDAELEAEMAALRAIQSEKSAGSAVGSGAPVFYNKEGLLKCLEDWETKDLPFLANMQIGQYKLNVENELDDLEREVCR
jgi:hypothetical protein